VRRVHFPWGYISADVIDVIEEKLRSMRRGSHEVQVVVPTGFEPVFKP